MTLAIENEPVPLKIDDTDTVRVGKTRVRLDTVVTAYNMGYSPEEIINQYPVLELADAYLVIGYYLRHQTEIDAFIQDNEKKAEEARKRFEAKFGSPPTKSELLARRKAEQV